MPVVLDQPILGGAAGGFRLVRLKVERYRAASPEFLQAPAKGSRRDAVDGPEMSREMLDPGFAETWDWTWAPPRSSVFIGPAFLHA